MAKNQVQAAEVVSGNGNGNGKENNFHSLKVTEREGRGNDSPITKEFTISEFPKNRDGLLHVLENADNGQVLTMLSLLETQVKVFARPKLMNNETKAFAELLRLERREGKAVKRQALMQDQAALASKLASGELDQVAFLREFNRITTEILELDKRKPKAGEEEEGEKDE